VGEWGCFNGSLVTLLVSSPADDEDASDVEPAASDVDAELEVAVDIALLELLFEARPPPD